jgi:hypothetical protein
MKMKMKAVWSVVVLVLLGGSVACGQEGYIRDVVGTVELTGPGGGGWTAARTGQSVTKDTVISTGFKSTAQIALGNSTVTVRPLTRLSFEEILNIQGNETVSLSLRSGRIRADVTAPAGGRTDFTVRSPIATASVRGTSFEFDGVNLRVEEGVVHVTGGDGTAVYVGAGHEAASDPVTGRTAGAVEMAKGELSPALPEAAAEAVPEPAAIMPDAADTGFGFRWR